MSNQSQPSKQSRWKRTTLGHALPIRYGKARSEKHGLAREQTAVYGSSGVIDTFQRALTNGPTLIIGRKGTVGATHYSAEPCWPIDTVYFAEAEPDKDLRFFKYLLDHLQLGKMDRSTAVPGLSRDDYNAREVFIPLVEEQREIVAEIEKQFTRLEAGVGGLRRVQTNLKRYRAAVLKGACEGKLVPREVERWTKTTLGSVLMKIEAGKSFKCEERPPLPSEVGVVKVSAVTWGTFDEKETKTCLDKSRVDERYLIKPGDFLFSRANTIDLVGACVIAARITLKLMLSDKILRLRFTDAVTPQWILYWLRSEFGRAEIQRLSSGNQESMRNIGQDRIRQISIALPPLHEQQRIVAEVERRLSVVDEIGAIVKTNLRRATRVRQAILHTAFQTDYRQSKC